MNNEFKRLDLDQYKPLGEVVFDYLRNVIMSGDLKPGERLMENTIAEQLGVSRTPVREAIRKLEKEKFITMIPRKGAYVSRLTPKDILDVLEIRRVLEGFASKSACDRMSISEKKELRKCYEKFAKFQEKSNLAGMIDKDREFHDVIFKASKNDKLVDLVKELHEQFNRFRLIYFYDNTNYDYIQFWHLKILEAIESDDCDMAKVHAEAHIAAIEKSVIEWAEREEQESE